MATHAVTTEETAAAIPFESMQKISHLLVDETYRGAVMLGNVQCYAAAGNVRLVHSASGCVIALFLTQDDADAALATAGAGYELVAGTGYDVTDLL